MKKKSSQRRKDPNIYPPGWDYQRAKAVADYYDHRKDESVLEVSAGTGSTSGLVWMEVPQELVAEVRKLIVRRRRSA